MKTQRDSYNAGVEQHPGNVQDAADELLPERHQELLGRET